MKYIVTMTYGLLTALRFHIDMKVFDFLYTWLSIVRMSVSAHTFNDYMVYVNHIDSYIGNIDIEELTYQDVQRMYTSMCATDGAKQVLHMHSIFRIAINYALDIDVIGKNPLRGVILPKKEKYHPVFISGAELRRMLSLSDYYGIYNAVLLAGCLGLRRGECLALHRSDLDPDRNIITVSRSAEWKDGRRIISSPKSETSYRKLLISEAFATALLTHSHSDYFCDYSQSVLYKRFSALLRENSFKPMRFHDLRHTYASLLLESGVDIKVIQSRLGHSSVSLTLDTYAHVDVRSQTVSSTVLDYLIEEE